MKYMKKKVFVLGVILSVLMLAACASVPKKVKDGEGLVIGRVSFAVQNCAPYQGFKLNGNYKKGIALTLVDWDTESWLFNNEFRLQYKYGNLGL